MKSFDEIYETLPTNGWLSREEAYLLFRYASKVDGVILEVGSYQGRSTVLLASLGRPVYTIDPFDGFSTDLTGTEIRKALEENLASRKIENVKIIQFSIENAPLRPILLEHGGVGFAYLDGDHTFEGTVSQIVAAWTLRARIIAIHDVNDSGGGLQVREAAVRMLGPWKERVERLAVWDCRGTEGSEYEQNNY